MATSILLSIVLLQATASGPAVQPNAPPAPVSTPVSTSPTTVVASDSDASNPTVCRTVDVSGSAFPRKECHTMKVWNRRARDGY